MQGLLALLCTGSVGRFKIQLALGRRNKRLKKGGLLEKALSIIPGPAAPHPPCVMMRGVCGELGVQPVDGSDHTHNPVYAAHSPGHTPLHFLPHGLGATLW